MIAGARIGVLTLLLGVITTVQQEGAGTVSMLERLALRVAVERAVGVAKPGSRVVIDPMIVSAGDAPGARTASRRDEQRNDALSAEVGARVLSGETVLDCTVRPCSLRDADVFVSLSAPMIMGNRGTVSVTTLQRARRGLHYRTISVHMERVGATWKVVGVTELGVS